MSAERLEWLAPAPLWGTGVAVESPAARQPFLAELTSDRFVDQFLSIMGGQGGASPPDLGGRAPASTSDATPDGPYRLYQPLSQRYYLVVASLVCRTVGVPDRAVAAGAAERTTFVVRRLQADGTEEAWVPSFDPSTGSFVPAGAEALVQGERQLPMHPAPVAAFARPGTVAATFGMSEPGRRRVHYGFIPTTMGLQGASRSLYVIRTVFQPDPCRAVLSQPTRAFLLAGPRDTDAPARPDPVAI
jgi:hypothetical protein